MKRIFYIPFFTENPVKLPRLLFILIRYNYPSKREPVTGLARRRSPVRMPRAGVINVEIEEGFAAGISHHSIRSKAE